MRFTKLLPTLFTDLFKNNKKVLVIVGPTASGKSSLAIALAQEYNGEVISCDSRQIYKGLEIFSGAVTPETNKDVKHHLVSFLRPGDIYSADLFSKDALQIIDDLHNQGKLPIVAGGSGFWAQTLMYTNNFPAVEPDYKLRETLEQHSTEELFTMLHAKDPRRAAQSDPQNKKRLIRALEIISVLGYVPKMKHVTRKGYSFILVYLSPEKEVLDQRITKNVSQRMAQGLLAESDTALADLTTKQIEELGLGFKHVNDVRTKSISKEQFVEKITNEEVRYAKRQKTFCNKLFKKFKSTKVLITDVSQENRMDAIRKIL